jgi:hypothetical protein
MHQSIHEKNKKFSIGDIVMLDNGIPEFEDSAGLGVVIAIYPLNGIERNEVVVHWQKDVWLSGKNQIMGSYEIRSVNLKDN